MLTLKQRTSQSRAADARLVLPFELRSKSRLRTVIETGEEVAILLERGTIMRGGDKLLADDGRIVELVAADEMVSTVRADDPWQLARVSYHLGNRHVALQIGEGWVRYQHDHVLDDMVRGLGSHVAGEHAPVEPEAGAYGAHSHGNDHALIRGVK